MYKRGWFLVRKRVIESVAELVLKDTRAHTCFSHVFFRYLSRANASKSGSSLETTTDLVDWRWEFIKENKKVREKKRTRPRKCSRRKESFFFFSWSFSCFLDRFLGRVLFFLTFLFSFINSHLWLPSRPFDTHVIILGNIKECRKPGNGQSS